MMTSAKPVSVSSQWEGIFSGATGLWLALALLKFGNPVILDAQIQAPASPVEWLLQPWPIVWGYAFLCGLLLLGFSVWRWHTEAPRWLLVVPLVWLGWQGLSALQTVDLRLTLTTLKHFAAGVAAYYL